MKVNVKTKEKKDVRLGLAIRYLDCIRLILSCQSTAYLGGDDGTLQLIFGDHSLSYK